MPERDQDRDDAVWKDLVARLEETDSGTADRPLPDQPAADSGTDAQRLRAIFENRLPEVPSPGTPSGPRDYFVEEPDDDEGYVPPEPEPLGAGEPLLVLAWIGAVGSPLGLLLTAMLWRDAPFAAVLGMVVLFVASAVYLLFRLPQERDGYDDGARV
ncbi:CvpA family protein [Arthrobacter sp. CAU 1506]|uniref:CvpA family protein n=1 Tax=Arthrobacter sp. CAU 1506 TaxID=2560052 RepID=UPI0010ABFA05|nr:CvpA family protein [Arthrobacter sp. CAU 1506]TJY70709.1 CvpA family protein [Arthrobacter sp. CAU 1506]